jgi:hypothetical protein
MAKKLISRQQQKPALKKIKKYSLAGYNLSGVSQAPQASYYLGQSAADEAGKTQNVALQSLKETQDELKKLNEGQKEQQEASIKQGSMELGKLALSTGKDIIKERAAKKAAELAASQVAKNTATTTAKEFGTNAMMAADTGADLASTGASVGSTAVNAANTAGSFMSGVASYGQPVSAALAIGGEIIKNTGSDNNAATFTQKERNRYGVGNTMAKTGQFAGYGSMFGPVGTLVGAAAGLGYGIYDTIKDNKKSEEEAGKLAMADRDPMAAVNNAFIDSKMMDAYRGGNQMARYGGMSRYAMGGSGCPPGQTMNPYTGECEQIKIDWSNPGKTLSIGGAPVNDYTGLNRREAKDVYEQNKQQYNIDWAKARRVDIDSADPKTLQDRIPYPQMPYSPAEQRRVDAGKEPGTFFDHYQSDPKRPGTRMVNNWNNSLFENDQDLGFREETPVYSSQEQQNTNSGGGGGGLREFFTKKDKANYNNEGFTKMRKPDFFDRKQSRDCKKKMGVSGCLEFGGMYNDLGGTRYVDGGKIKPIPNSNDVEYVGDTHEEGGIKLDKYTEVEDKETGTKINGNQYFFSRVLKTPKGEPYSQAHKAIASNPSLDPISKKNIIKDLARQQEVKAGRDPKQIARSGGMRKFAAGGMGCPDGYINDPLYGCIPAVQDETKMNFVESGAYMKGKSPYGLPADVKEQTFNPNDLRSKKSVTDDEVKKYAESNNYTYNSKKKVYEKTDGKTKVKKTADELKKELAEKENTKVTTNVKNVYKTKDDEIPDYLLKEKQEGPVAKGNREDSFGYTLDGKEKSGKNLNLDKTWLEKHPGFIGGLAQLAGPAYAMLKPYKKTKGMAAAQSVTAPSLARVDKSGEIEDARRQQNAMNTYLKNTNLGPGKIIAMQSVASKTADEIAKISLRQDAENRAIKNAEAQIAAEVAGRNQAAQLETSKANMLADINQNQYMDERNLGVAESLGKGLAGMSMDQRKLDMQYRIARGLDKTGALNRYEIMEQLRKQAKNPESSVYQKSEAELQEIASELGYKVIEVVADDPETKKRLGGMGRKYTSRLGDLSTKRNTTAKQSIQ